jgi:hypothetical protein
MTPDASTKANVTFNDARKDTKIRRPVSLLDRAPQRELVGDSAGIIIAIEAGHGLEADAAQFSLHAKVAQHLHGIGRHLDAGADPGKLRGLLEDAHADAAGQGGGNGQASDAGPDDPDHWLCVYHLVSSIMLFEAEMAELK